jgi:hypothetical protein
LLETLNVIKCPKLEYMPVLACMKTLKRLSVEGCPALHSIYNNLTDFVVLNELDLYEGGVGEAIANNTDNNLVEQVSALQRRPGFKYGDYTGASTSNE